eukprot:2123034-Rhodomonas_salina.3
MIEEGRECCEEEREDGGVEDEEGSMREHQSEESERELWIPAGPCRRICARAPVGLDVRMCSSCPAPCRGSCGSTWRRHHRARQQTNLRARQEPCNAARVVPHRPVIRSHKKSCGSAHAASEEGDARRVFVPREVVENALKIVALSPTKHSNSLGEIGVHNVVCVDPAAAVTVQIDDARHWLFYFHAAGIYRQIMTTFEFELSSIYQLPPSERHQTPNRRREDSEGRCTSWSDA